MLVGGGFRVRVRVRVRVRGQTRMRVRVGMRGVSVKVMVRAHISKGGKYEDICKGQGTDEDK